MISSPLMIYAPICLQMLNNHVWHLQLIQFPLYRSEGLDLAKNTLSTKIILNLLLFHYSSLKMMASTDRDLLSELGLTGIKCGDSACICTWCVPITPFANSFWDQCCASAWHVHAQLVFPLLQYEGVMRVLIYIIKGVSPRQRWGEGMLLRHGWYMLVVTSCGFLIRLLNHHPIQAVQISV